MTRIRTVLSIAGSDPSAGAGIQADIKTCSSLDTYALTIITALTAQNTQGVNGICPITPDFVKNQFESLLKDIHIDAIKIGMLHDSEMIQAVSDCLIQTPSIPIVLDPVMVSTSNHRLLSLDAIETLKTCLLPKATLITPNLQEACCLTGETCFSDNMISRLLDLNAQHILIKDIHPNSENAIDVFYHANTKETIRLNNKRINTKHTHGTGCTLSSAIASFLAQDETVTQAIQLGKNYTFQAIKTAQKLQVGQGHGPLDHFYKRHHHDTLEPY